ncbi:NlpC/P60 family protein [uncultured Paracoccus sp.]|uniref:NlpC/P60 family protein n=1 Tax=uncultured Paracoccus sp. TaxID=189685 RepID=UPI002619867B|nr:NlpC/P60 family protein [uncultured Paracoccus sp.]
MSRQVVSAARAWIGTPYVHQASVLGAGADCLGLVRGVWRCLYGCEPEVLPAYTADWGETGSNELLMTAALRHMTPVQEGQLAPGDLLLFRMRDGAVAKHLGILSVTGEAPRFIHAYDRHGVVESPLSEPWRARIAAGFRFPA